jgi:KTSC domain
MHREPVVSISIAAVGYDPERRLLEVEYKNGKIVQYGGVPADEQEDRMTDEALNKRLKRPAFPSRDRKLER